MSALSKYSTKVTPQTQRSHPDQIQNSEGGYVFEVRDKERLHRFLILGVTGGTYYASERKHMEDNVDFLTSLIKKGEKLVLDEAVRVSTEGLAYSNSPAIFAVAMVLGFGKDKAAAREAVGKVCRTATHLYELAQYIDNTSGWGRAKRRAVADWFLRKTPESLAYQAVKYRSRSV